MRRRQDLYLLGFEVCAYAQKIGSQFERDSKFERMRKRLGTYVHAKKTLVGALLCSVLAIVQLIHKPTLLRWFVHMRRKQDFHFIGI